MAALTSKAFWSDASERVVSTFAQTLLGSVTASAIDVIHFGWKSALVVSGVAAGVSLLKAVVKAQPADPADVPPVSVTPKFPGSSPLA